METHVVNNAIGLKAPAVRYRQSGDELDSQAVYDGIENLDRFHGQVTGVFTGDEHLSGTLVCGTLLISESDFETVFERFLSGVVVDFTSELERSEILCKTIF
jgi:hypothetical protein